MRILLTGYPGFLGTAVLPRILARSPETTAICLVQPKFAALARERASQFGDRVQIVEGDITSRIDLQPVDEIFHLAAIYDLSVSRELGMRVNVNGTQNLLDFAERCPSLRRFQYVSTCYVSGRHPGLFREDDLDTGQRFNNFYEETKFLAEVEVRQRTSLPYIIYRPSVVVGDSRSGETQKFDGPYFLMQWILRQPRIAIVFVPIGSRRIRFNTVPRDFIIDAIDALSTRAKPKTCYQLADPAPLTVDEIIDAMAVAASRKIVRVPTPMPIAKLAAPLLRIPREAVAYFRHPTTYDTTNAQRDLGFAPPRLADYLPRLVEFARAHPEIGATAMA
ncbi:MAG TPA: SDR family oxidoreductase [Thermoanaerobaculia bacterium]|nr:SDR family oxidoreductase [Thermoanaerobaculia bacterium]